MARLFTFNIAACETRILCSPFHTDFFICILIIELSRKSIPLFSNPVQFCTDAVIPVYFFPFVYIVLKNGMTFL